ncbi:MAG: putative DNA-binding domain-containing protein [Chromatiaceae bacterium]
MVDGTTSGFQAAQYALTAHLRDPDRNPPPADLEDRRVRIYRDLVFNNVESLLAGNFPVLHRILPEAHWKGLVRDFFIRHRARTPLFTELAQEFLDFIQNQRAAEPSDPPFLLELAHYEWVELALMISVDEPDPTGLDPNGDLLAGPPALSPLAWPLSYRFPVHRIGPDHQPQEPPAEPTHLVVYRNRAERVEFLEINAVTQRLLQLLAQETAQSGRAHLERIAAELRHPDPTQVITFGAGLLDDLRARGIILGTRLPGTLPP